MKPAKNPSVAKTHRAELKLRKRVACNVWSEMKKLRMTQSRLARLTGDTRMRLVYLIHAKHAVALDVVVRVADALNKNISELTQRPAQEDYAAWNRARRKKNLGNRR